eukprot:2166953-Rhodomonas_salina.4
MSGTDLAYAAARSEKSLNCTQSSQPRTVCHHSCASSDTGMWYCQTVGAVGSSRASDFGWELGSTYGGREQSQRSCQSRSLLYTQMQTFPLETDARGSRSACAATWSSVTHTHTDIETDIETETDTHSHTQTHTHTLSLGAAVYPRGAAVYAAKRVLRRSRVRCYGCAMGWPVLVRRRYGMSGTEYGGTRTGHPIAHL